MFCRPSCGISSTTVRQRNKRIYSSYQKNNSLFLCLTVSRLPPLSSSVIGAWSAYSFLLSLFSCHLFMIFRLLPISPHVTCPWVRASGYRSTMACPSFLPLNRPQTRTPSGRCWGGAGPFLTGEECGGQPTDRCGRRYGLSGWEGTWSLTLCCSLISPSVFRLVDH